MTPSTSPAAARQLGPHGAVAAVWPGEHAAMKGIWPMGRADLGVALYCCSGLGPATVFANIPNNF
jgi:hypothetical protein